MEMGGEAVKVVEQVLKAKMENAEKMGRQFL